MRTLTAFLSTVLLATALTAPAEAAPKKPAAGAADVVFDRADFAAGDARGNQRGRRARLRHRRRHHLLHRPPRHQDVGVRPLDRPRAAAGVHRHRADRVLDGRRPRGQLGAGRGARP
ncbi:hypothetical protein ACFSTC_62545 [Nonomuraea ferruginea]